MDLAVIVIKALVGIVPLIFSSVPPPNRDRQERREVSRAKARWWAARRKLHLATERGRPVGVILRHREQVARWAEVLDRLDEDVLVEEAAFREIVKEAGANR